MKQFEYSDEDISDQQLLVAIPSMVIGVIILTFARTLAGPTKAADGLLLILIGGLFSVLFIWLIAKFSSSFRDQTFFDFASSVMTKPIASVICFVFAIHYICLTAFEVRKLTDITRHYLLGQTPAEVLALSFLFIIIYAVSGSRAGLFRLNMMFLPFVLFVSLAVLLFNIKLIEVNNLQPILKTNVRGYAEGVVTMFSMLASGGAGIVLFYTSLVKAKEKLPKMAAMGMAVPVILFLAFYFISIGVYGNTVTANLLYPSIELGKSVDLPGGIFERFESIFFVIWIMAIFNTTALVFDLAILTINYIFKNTKKIKLIFILAPIIFFISMVPQNITESTNLGKFSIYSLLIYLTGIVFLLFVIAKIRGVKAGG